MSGAGPFSLAFFCRATYDRPVYKLARVLTSERSRSPSAPLSAAASAWPPVSVCERSNASVEPSYSRASERIAPSSPCRQVTQTGEQARLRGAGRPPRGSLSLPLPLPLPLPLYPPSPLSLSVSPLGQARACAMGAIARGPPYKPAGCGTRQTGRRLASQTTRQLVTVYHRSRLSPTCAALRAYKRAASSN